MLLHFSWLRIYSHFRQLLILLQVTWTNKQIKIFYQFQHYKKCMSSLIHKKSTFDHSLFFIIFIFFTTLTHDSGTTPLLADTCPHSFLLCWYSVHFFFWVTLQLYSKPPVRMKSSLTFINMQWKAAFPTSASINHNKKMGSVVTKCKRCFTEIVRSFMILITSE